MEIMQCVQRLNDGEGAAVMEDARYVRFPVVTSALVPAPRNHLAKHRHESFLIDAATRRIETLLETGMDWRSCASDDYLLRCDVQEGNKALYAQSLRRMIENLRADLREAEKRFAYPEGDHGRYRRCSMRRTER